MTLDDLFKKLEELDVKMGDFTKVQIDAKENYRTFHDWLLLKVFGDIWLSELTSFSKAASKNTIDAQIECLKQAIREKFAKDMPDLDL